MDADDHGFSFRENLLGKIFAPFAFSAVSFCRQLNDSTGGGRCLLSGLTVVLSANLCACGGYQSKAAPAECRSRQYYHPVLACFSVMNPKENRVRYVPFPALLHKESLSESSPVVIKACGHVITDVRLIEDEPRVPLRGHWLRSSVDGLIAQLFLVGAVAVPAAPDLLKHRYGRAGKPCGKAFLRSGARISIWAFRRRASTTD